MSRRQLVDLNGMAMAVFTFAGGVLIGTGGLWQQALSVGSLLLGLAFMARLLRSETLQEALDGVLETIQEEDARRQAKRQRLLALLAPLEAAQREQGLRPSRPGPQRKIEASTQPSD